MNQKHIQHLYHRASFGLNFNDLSILKSKSKDKIVSDLFSNSDKTIPLKIDLTELDQYRNKSRKKLMEEFDEQELQKIQKINRSKLVEFNHAWIARLNLKETLLREKMTLFWANVFVCRDNNILFTQQYNNTLRKNALGNFRDFVKAISKEPSMIKYLNLNQNLKRKPNENFARELMELFTLGVGNYTEKDIKEAARAFTGYSFGLNGVFYIRKKQQDVDMKTFFEKTGNFNGDDIIDIILEQKQCAKFICTKIYTYFINPTINENRLEEITTIFYKDYDISNLMKYIFNSNWFYNEENIGVKIKSPMELLIGIQTIVPLQFKNKKILNYLQKMMGQTLLNPPNVAGWKGDRYWIDSNTLMFRMKLPSLLLNNAVINLAEKGEFEDSFEAYYKGNKKGNKFVNTIVNWDEFQNVQGALSSGQLKDLLIIATLDKDTQNLIESLQIDSNKDFCIQLMSLPEYQLC